ncbi:hypothetical protein SAY87_002638 [Trapa incisa]|uniref:Uncharacterized protein n=1 Tax=Trapa incisa TaxID=236973 RepID=A0AAN7PVG4_9MYRT|nr:hypothetical protein SAY87_002638 [Trapa incisa]
MSEIDSFSAEETTTGQLFQVEEWLNSLWADPPSMDTMVDTQTMETTIMGFQLPHKDKVKDNKKRKRGMDDQGNHGQGIEDITPVLPKRPRLVWTSDLHQKFLNAIEIIHQRKSHCNHEMREVVALPREILKEMQKMGENSLTREQISSHLQKHRADLKGIQESLSTKNEISTRQFSLIKPSSTTQTAAYWHAPYHFPFYCAIPDYFSNINQQLVPAMVAPTTKQFIFPRSLPIQPLKPLHTSIAEGPGHQQLRSPHMTIPCCPLGNHSSPLFGLQPCANLNNVSTGTDISDLTVEPTVSINSNGKYDQIYGFLKACIDSNTTNSTTTECATPDTQDFAASTCLNEVVRQPELEDDISWNNNLIEFEGLNGTTLQGLQPLPN